VLWHHRPVIPTSLIRPLLLQGPDPAHLSAASGLACAGRWLYAAADDELGLGCFPLDGDAPGELRRLAPPGVPPLPAGHDARKARKPDTEALAHLPPLPQAPHGALLALGSGSRPNRQQGALWALDADGALAGQPHAVDLAPLYAPLHQRFGALNIEGAFVEGGALVLLQRGHRGAPVNASIRFAWPAVGAWLAGQGGTPPPLAVAQHALGGLDGVPLGFTDGAALPGGGWLFSAAAEDSADAYLDGECAGSVIGEVDAAGTLRGLVRLDQRCKVEGLEAIGSAVAGGAVELLMVTDADDRAAPAQMLRGRWPG
jgi:hypothetical protein